MQITGVQIHDIKTLRADSGHCKVASWLSLGEIVSGRFESKVTFFFTGSTAETAVIQLERAINGVSSDVNRVSDTCQPALTI